MLRRPNLLALLVLVGLVSVLAACANADLPFVATPTPRNTPTPTITPTPIPAILRVPRVRYAAPGDAFALVVPAGWEATDTGGGVRFDKPDESGARIQTFFQPIPDGIESGLYFSDFISTTLALAEDNDPTSYEVLSDATTPDGVRELEVIAALEPGATPQRLRGEWRLQNDVIVGLALAAPPATWADIEPLWPLLHQNFEAGNVAGSGAPVGLTHVHSSLPISLTVPYDWQVVDETSDGVFLADLTESAQFAAAIVPSEERASAHTTARAVAEWLGDTPQQEGYQSIESKTLPPSGHIEQFEVLTEDGFQRNELRVIGSGDKLYVTNFSAPALTWDLYQPAYQALLDGLQWPASTPPSEAAQDDDPLLGVEVGPVQWRIADGGALWVSAPIYNLRTRNLSDLTAAVQLHDEAGELFGAESWRMQQKILPAGGVTYLTLRIPPSVTSLDRLRDVSVELLNPEDTRAQAPAPWAFVTGSWTPTADQGATLDLTLRNDSDETRRYIYVTGLVYDTDDNLAFTQSDLRALPRAVPPGGETTLTIRVPGPLPEIGRVEGVGAAP